jgi:hypothetical protein
MPIIAAMDDATCQVDTARVLRTVASAIASLPLSSQLREAFGRECLRDGEDCSSKEFETIGHLVILRAGGVLIALLELIERWIATGTSTSGEGSGG